MGGIILPRLLLDTNILVSAIRENDVWDRIKSGFDPLMVVPRPVYCSVTEGELRSLALQFNWGPNKKSQVEFLLSYYEEVPIEQERIMLAYAEIDYAMKRAGRKMGKNDLWIAATARAENLMLLTTDRDFDAISPRFIQREWIDPG